VSQSNTDGAETWDAICCATFSNGCNFVWCSVKLNAKLSFVKAGGPIGFKSDSLTVTVWANETK